MEPDLFILVCVLFALGWIAAALMFGPTVGRFLRDQLDGPTSGSARGRPFRFLRRRRRYF